MLSTWSGQQWDLSINKLNDNLNLGKFENDFDTGKLELLNKLHTAKLQIQYLDYIATLNM